VWRIGVHGWVVVACASVEVVHLPHATSLGLVCEVVAGVACAVVVVGVVFVVASDFVGAWFPDFEVVFE
jgi:high-affinity Fe2+/Pb2+ permease